MWEDAGFQEKAADEFVFVSLDFPRSEEVKAKVPNPERNEEIMRQFGVRGFPTVFVLTPEGDVVGQTGYLGIPADEYLNNLRELAVEGRKALEQAKEFATGYAAAEDKPGYVRQAIELVSGMDASSPGIADYASVVRKAFELDPDGSNGLRTAALAVLLKAGIATDDEIAAARKVDPKNEAGVLESLVMHDLMQLSKAEQLEGWTVEAKRLAESGNYHDREMCQEIFANAARLAMQFLDDPEMALMFARKAKELGDLPQPMASLVEDIISSATKALEAK